MCCHSCFRAALIICDVPLDFYGSPNFPPDAECVIVFLHLRGCDSVSRRLPRAIKTMQFNKMVRKIIWIFYHAQIPFCLVAH
jgi:hypothetical protein